MADDEPVDVVDEHDRVLRTVTRAEMRRDRLRHRCTFVAVLDTADRVLIHLRSPDKDMWPSRWDLAAGGVVTSGEDWDHAAARELAEELGITGAELEPLGGGRYEDAEVAEVARLWRVRWDGPVTFADGEVVEARWVTRDELRTRLADDDFVPDSVALLGPHLLAARDAGPRWVADRPAEGAQ